MKRSHLIAVMFSTLALGFLVGRVSSAGNNGANGNEDDGGSSTKLRTRLGDRPAAEISNSSTSRLRQEIRKAPSDKLAAMVYRTLEIGDPIVRRQLLYELFARMDASNFHEMTLELNRISLETGRDNYDEWLLMHTRAGQVAGQAAMERWEKEGARKTDQAWRTMWGWASTDPDSAQKWLDGIPDIKPEERNKLLTALMSGAIVSDQDKAMKMIASLSEEERIRCVPQFTFHLVQNAGKDGAIAWLQSVNASEPDTGYAKRVTEQVFDKLAWSGANQTNAKSMVGDLQRLSSVVPIDENWIVRSMGQIRDRKATGGIELLDQIARNPTLKDVPLTDRAWNSAVKFALERNPAAVGTWLQNNTDSPIHQKVAQMSGQALPAEAQ
jgi:hypothetical protein